MELATAYLMLNAVKMSSNGIHTGRVANKNNTVSQEFGLQMKMEA
jgi:hypothetical protein